MSFAIGDTEPRPAKSVRLEAIPLWSPQHVRKSFLIYYQG